MKEIKKIIKNRDTYYVSKLKIVKISVLSIQIYGHKAIPIKVSRMTFCTYQTDAKIYMGRQRNHSNQRKLKKETVVRLTLPDFKAYYKCIVVKRV